MFRLTRCQIALIAVLAVCLTVGVSLVIRRNQRFFDRKLKTRATKEILRCLRHAAWDYREQVGSRPKSIEELTAWMHDHSKGDYQSDCHFSFKDKAQAGRDAWGNRIEIRYTMDGQGALVLLSSGADGAFENVPEKLWGAGDDIRL